MKNYIEALLAREKARYDQVAIDQKEVNGQLETLRKANQDLVMEASYRKDKIDFLKRMLKEETDNA